MAYADTPEGGGDEVLTAAKRYTSLEITREPYLQRARACAKLTIPTLIPERGQTPSAEFYCPFQGIGARGVNNISSKLLLTLFPSTGGAFFRMVVDEEQLKKAGALEQKTTFEDALRKFEEAVMKEVEAQALRVPIFEALKHLVVAGNVCLWSPKEGGLKVFHLNRYVVQRDAMGNVTELVTKESVAHETLPPDLQALCMQPEDTLPSKSDLPSDTATKNVDLYTHVRLLKKNRWQWYSEIKGHKIEGSEGSSVGDKQLPWIVLRFARVDGESYGRSYVEEYLGDLKTDEGLSQAIVEGSIGAAKLLFLVNPNGQTNPKVLAQAPNGAIIAGREEDVTCVQTQKSADMAIASATIQRVEERLSFAFLLNSSIQRSGERVTAEEIRYMAGELEDALGGVYSILSVEFQLPLVKRIIAQLTARGELKALPPKLVRPTIVTGLEALSRGHEAAKLTTYFQALQGIFGPEAVSQMANLTEAAARFGIAFGVDTKGLIKTQDEMNQQNQAAQQQEMIKHLGPKVIDAGSKLVAAGGTLPQATTPANNTP